MIFFFLKKKKDLAIWMNLLKEQTLITLKNYSHVDDINEAYYVDEIGIH